MSNSSTRKTSVQTLFLCFALILISLYLVVMSSHLTRMDYGMVTCTNLEGATYYLLGKSVEIAMLLAPKDAFCSEDAASLNHIVNAR